MFFGARGAGLQGGVAENNPWKRKFQNWRGPKFESGTGHLTARGKVLAGGGGCFAGRGGQGKKKRMREAVGGKRQEKASPGGFGVLRKGCR